MKKIITIGLLIIASISSTHAVTYIKGYVRSNGTYVAPHYRSDSNNSRYDNWTTKGNRNPYTGKKGYKTW